MQEFDGTVMNQFTMQSGDVAYLPQGWLICERAVNQPSQIVITERFITGGPNATEDFNVLVELHVKQKGVLGKLEQVKDIVNAGGLAQALEDTKAAEGEEPKANVAAEGQGKDADEAAEGQEPEADTKAAD